MSRASASIHHTAKRFENASRTTACKRLIYDACAPFARVSQQRFEIALGKALDFIGKIEEIEGNSSLESAVTLVSRRANAHRFVISIYHSFRF